MPVITLGPAADSQRRWGRRSRRSQATAIVCIWHLSRSEYVQRAAKSSPRYHHMRSVLAPIAVHVSLVEADTSDNYVLDVPIWTLEELNVANYFCELKAVPTSMGNNRDLRSWVRGMSRVG